MIKSRHGLVTIAGIVICVLLALLTGRDLLFGLVMGTVFSSGLGIGRRIIAQITANAPADNIMPAKIIGPVAGAIVVGIITALILSAIQGAVDVSPMEGDDFIATIVKSSSTAPPRWLLPLASLRAPGRTAGLRLDLTHSP